MFASKKLDGENYDTEHACFCEYKRYLHDQLLMIWHKHTQWNRHCFIQFKFWLIIRFMFTHSQVYITGQNRSNSKQAPNSSKDIFLETYSQSHTTVGWWPLSTRNPRLLASMIRQKVIRCSSFWFQLKKYKRLWASSMCKPNCTKTHVCLTIKSH